MNKMLNIIRYILGKLTFPKGAIIEDKNHAVKVEYKDDYNVVVHYVRGYFGIWSLVFITSQKIYK